MLVSSYVGAADLAAPAKTQKVRLGLFTCDWTDSLITGN
jgi:hypothetical protein